MNELTWTNWKEWIYISELKWRNWHSWIDMDELKRMNSHEWLEVKELTWMNWNEGIEMNELTWTNWTEWIEPNERHEKTDMNKLKYKWNEVNDRHEQIEMSKCMNWNERMEMNELKSTNWKEWSAKSASNLLIFYIFYLKSSSCYSLVHILSTTFRIEARTPANRDPPGVTTDGYFTSKNIGFRARECFQLWIHAFPVAHTWQLHDDVVDMMIRLTWWCDSWLWESFVIQKFPK